MDLGGVVSSLAYVGVWLLQALVATPTNRKKVKKALLGEEGLDLMLSWWYGTAQHLYRRLPHAQVVRVACVGRGMSCDLT